MRHSERAEILNEAIKLINTLEKWGHLDYNPFIKNKGKELIERYELFLKDEIKTPMDEAELFKKDPHQNATELRVKSFGVDK